MDIVVEDIETATERPLVTGPAWHVVGGWSPDGGALLVMRVTANTDQDLFVADPRSGALRHLTPHEGDVSNVPAGWLADGRPVAITDHGRDHLYLAAYDAATGAREVIDAPEWDVELAASSADGRAQVWSVNADGYSTLRWQRDRKRGGEHRLDGVCEDLVISADGSLAAFHRTSATETPQLWLLELATGAARQVFETTRVAPRTALAEPELIRIPGADWMASDPGIDPERLAVYGGSYGGFATLLCVTTMPERWRCAVDVFGVANLVTMIEHAQPNWRRFLKLWIGDLETDRAKLVERSPITHMDKVRCPMLVIQGSNDPRVPKEESDQVVARLRARGVPVEYMVFEDEGHGFTKRANSDTAHARIVDFLTEQLTSR